MNALIDSISRRTTTIDILTCSRKPIARSNIKSSGKLGNLKAIAYHQTQVNLKAANGSNCTCHLDHLKVRRLGAIGNA
ncbi:hypothetical protein [Microcoleus sp. BROC3]|uniref:hypothetical protein n=1 Tax=Microcoleus sp. BROC3 TaxID=3055323 RepID=UPI002FD6C4D5